MSENNEEKPKNPGQVAQDCVEALDKIIRDAGSDGRNTLLIRENIIRVLMARNVASIALSKQVATHYLYNRTVKFMKEPVLQMGDRLLDIYKTELEAKEIKQQETAKEKQV